jgi:C-terminal processing protease CtpA/Prc
MKMTAIAAAALGLLVQGTALGAEPPRSGHPVFDRTVRLVADNFYDVSALDRFFAAAQREIDDPKQPINKDSSAATVDRAIDAVLAGLGASHTGRYRQDGIDYFELADIFRYAIRRDLDRLFPPDGEVRYAGIGMIAKPANGLWFVTDVYDGSPADRAGIEVGDQLIAVDGRAYDEIGSFTGKVGKAVAVELRRRPGATPITVNATVESMRPLDAFERAIGDSARIVERDGKKIGYIRLWTLAAPGSMEIVARALAVGKLTDADGLVLDLRGRWGGGQADAAELFVGDTPPFRLIPRNGEEVLANVRWRRPLVAIIDEGARSGLEVFAYGLKVNGVPLIGTRTAGAVLAGRAFLLPDDSILILAVNDTVIDDDLRLEGRGVQPDISVPFTLPFAAGSDPQFDAAVDEMGRMLARGDAAPG